MPGLEVWCKTLFVFIHMYIIQSEKNNNNISLFSVVTCECVEENIHTKLGGCFHRGYQLPFVWSASAPGYVETKHLLYTEKLNTFFILCWEQEQCYLF